MEGRVEGVKLGSSELLMKMFADDTILILKAEERAVKEVWEETELIL